MLDVSLFFHECSVFTSKLDPNYNLVYKFNTYLFIYFILLHCQFARPRVLFIYKTIVLTVLFKGLKVE